MLPSSVTHNRGRVHVWLGTWFQVYGAVATYFQGLVCGYPGPDNDSDDPGPGSDPHRKRNFQGPAPVDPPPFSVATFVTGVRV